MPISGIYIENMKRYCLTLDLKDDPALIEEYKQHHRNVWPEVRASIRASGIRDMEIYSISTRLFMIIETEDTFSFEQKAAADEANPKVQAWEKLMWQFQQPLPEAKPGEKWIRMERIFKLDD